MKELLQDNSGGFSSMRLVFLVWNFGVFIIWAYLSFLHKQIHSIDSTILTCLAIGTSGKVIQRFGENNNSEVIVNNKV